MLLTLFILCASAVPALAAPSADEAMRLSDISGTITVKNASGIPLEASEGMPLYNGYTVETGAASSALIKLDGSKEITLDSRSICSVKHNGKTAETFLIAGTVFFKTDRPLGCDEAFIIRSQDIINSVRGSFGCQNETGVWLLYGTTIVQTSAVGQQSADKQVLQSGQGAFLEQASGSGTGANGQTLSTRTLTSDSVPLVAISAIAGDQAMQRKIEGVPTLDLQAMIGSLEGKKAEAAAADQKAVLVAQAAVTAQNAAIGTSSANYPAGSSAETTQSGGPSAFPGGEAYSETPVSGNASDSQALMAQLSGGSATLDSSGGWTLSYTGVTVGAGQTLTITGAGTVSMPNLTIAEGGAVNVSAGATLAVSGTDLVWRGSLTNNGTVNCNADLALLGTVVNNGTFINSGVFSIAPEAGFNGGTVNNTGTIIVSDGGSFDPGAADGVVIRN